MPGLPPPAQAFLTTRFGAAPAHLFVLIWQLQDKRSTWFRVSDLAAAAEFAVRLESDAYVGCALSPGDFGRWSRVKADRAAGIPGLWLDVDVKGPAHKEGDLPATSDDARDLLDSISLAPTEVIHSGHGLQAWWLFEEPWIFASDTEREQAADLLRRFQRQFHQHAAECGWRLDSTCDLARVLRIPGTWNCKTDPVQVQLQETGGPRYTPGDFFALLEPTPEPSSPAERNGHASHPLPVGKSPLDRARQYVARMPESVSGCRGHDAAFNVAQALVRGFNLGDEDAWTLLLEFNARCKPAWSEEELRHKLDDARHKSRLPAGYILNRTPAGPPHGGQPSQSGHQAADSPRNGVAIILDYFRARYAPDFRRGSVIHCADGREVSQTEACSVPTSPLIAELETATDTPRYGNGDVKRDGLPGFFRRWASTAWGDLRDSLPDEDHAQLAPDGGSAGEEFRRMVRDALLSEVVLGEVIGKGDFTQTERQPLIEWCDRFARPGPWRSIRGKRCWCKRVPGPSLAETVLTVAIRQELFAQIRADRRLCEMGQNTFSRRAERYGVGHSSRTDRPEGRSAVVLDKAFLAGLTSTLTEEDTADVEP